MAFRAHDVQATELFDRRPHLELVKTGRSGIVQPFGKLLLPFGQCRFRRGLFGDSQTESLLRQFIRAVQHERPSSFAEIQLLGLLLLHTGPSHAEMAVDRGQDVIVLPLRLCLARTDVQSLPVIDELLSSDLAELDVRTTAGHVGGDHHGTELPRALDDVRFPLMLFRIQHLVRNVRFGLEHVTEHFTLVDTGRTDQHGASGIVVLSDLVHDRVPLALLGREDPVIAIISLNRNVGWNRDHVQ